MLDKYEIQSLFWTFCDGHINYSQLNIIFEVFTYLTYYILVFICRLGIRSFLQNWTFISCLFSYIGIKNYVAVMTKYHNICG